MRFSLKKLVYLLIAYVGLSLIACKEEKVLKIPSFNLLMLDSTTIFNTSNIPEGNPIVLIYYSPDCSHCQKETASLLKSMDSLKNTRFYFITNDPQERMDVYNKMFKLYNYSNIVLGRDFKYFFPGYFPKVSPPYTVICDKYKRIRAIAPGERSAHEIITYVNSL